jgi:hypothetical protein
MLLMMLMLLLPLLLLLVYDLVQLGLAGVARPPDGAQFLLQPLCVADTAL